MVFSFSTAPMREISMVVSHQSFRVTSKPSWLQASLTDLEQRFNKLSLLDPNAIIDDVSDSFAGRAENYYLRRPQLLSLLHDLYNKYLSLADRYVFQTQLKHAKQPSSIQSDLSDADPSDLLYSSDAESSLSFQALNPPSNPTSQVCSVADEVVVELVMKFVENDVIRHEVGILQKYQSDSTRKMELQKSLLEVLESERMVLLAENAKLGYKAKAITEENERLAAEVGFMRRKAGELGMCVVKLRENHRVCMLGRKIEALQAQIYGLEKRNRECYEVMARREEEKAELVRELSAELDKVKPENRRLREAVAVMAKGRGGGGKWWRGKMKGWILCGSHVREHETTAAAARVMTI